jgi:hypothetical protein
MGFGRAAVLIGHPVGRDHGAVEQSEGMARFALGQHRPAPRPVREQGRAIRDRPRRVPYAGPAAQSSCGSRSMPQPANRLAIAAAIGLTATLCLWAPSAAQADPALECTVEGKPGIRIAERCIARDTTRLDLSYTRLSDLSPLAGLTGLETLDISLTQVSDLSQLAGVPGLDLLTTPDGTLYVVKEIEQAIAEWTP